MTLDDYLRIGETITLGAHTFTPDEIKVFAAKYDPQPFHLDEREAEASVFGRLCASGWHTCAMWMRYNLEKRQDMLGAWTGEGPAPVFGPSPGFQNLKWLKPVYAGETITFTRTAKSHRPVASRPGWHLLTLDCEAFDSAGDKVLEFESAVLLQAG
jgi:acyl dehydratase